MNVLSNNDCTTYGSSCLYLGKRACKLGYSGLAVYLKLDIENNYEILDAGGFLSNLLYVQASHRFHGRRATSVICIYFRGSA